MYLKNEDTEAGWLNIGGRYATKIWIPKYWSEEWGWVEGHWEDSTANSGGIYFPYGVAVDDNLNVYVANPGDPGFQIFITPGNAKKTENGAFSAILIMVKSSASWDSVAYRYPGNVICNDTAQQLYPCWSGFDQKAE
jgi:hypothetical protein